jgi:hypothetical protein
MKNSMLQANYSVYCSIVMDIKYGYLEHKQRS